MIDGWMEGWQAMWCVCPTLLGEQHQKLSIGLGKSGFGWKGSWDVRRLLSRTQTNWNSRENIEDKRFRQLIYIHRRLQLLYNTTKRFAAEIKGTQTAN